MRGLLLSKCSRWLYFMHRKNFVISWLRCTSFFHFLHLHFFLSFWSILLVHFIERIPLSLWRVLMYNVCIVNKKRVKTRKKNINMQWEVKYVGRVVSSLPGCRTCRNILSTNSTLAKMHPQGGDFKITFGGSSYFSDWRSFCFTTRGQN